MIGIIDYGMGNIHSVQKALELQGGRCRVVRTPKELLSCEKAVLPGVGAFGDAMKHLSRTGLKPAVKEFCASGRPFLGICLGMHLLFAGSSESPGVQGLALLEGTVRRFPAMKGLKVPHMGWNTVTRTGACRLMSGIREGSVYFCHSFYPVVADTRIAAGMTGYGRVSFPSVICAGTISAVQFHPEKSQAVGLRMLKNFVAQR